MRWVRFDTPLNIKPATTILLQIRPIQSSLNQLVMKEKLEFIKEYSRGVTEMDTVFIFNKKRVVLPIKRWGVFPFIVTKIDSIPSHYELKLDRMFSYN